MQSQRLIVKVRIQLVALDGNDLFIDLGHFYPTLGVTWIRGRLVICQKSGNFQCRVAVQTYVGDPEAPDAPVTVTTGTNVGHQGTVGKYLVDFDPTASDNGNIDAKEGYRVGLFYSSTNSTISRGDVILELYADA